MNHADQFQWQWQGRHKVYYWSLNSDDDVLYMMATVLYVIMQDHWNIIHENVRKCDKMVNRFK